MLRPRLTPLAGLCGAVALAVLTGCAGSPAVSAPAVVNAPGAVQTSSYGTVTGISTVDRRASGGGAVLGAVVGGVLGHQVGGGTGRDVATVAGAVAGGVAGHKIEERRAGANEVYRVDVRFDDGRTEAYQFSDLNGLRVGDRVRWDNGQLQRY